MLITLRVLGSYQSSKFFSPSHFLMIHLLIPLLVFLLLLASFSDLILTFNLKRARSVQSYDRYTLIVAYHFKSSSLVISKSNHIFANFRQTSIWVSWNSTRHWLNLVNCFSSFSFIAAAKSLWDLPVLVLPMRFSTNFQIWKVCLLLHWFIF